MTEDMRNGPELIRVSIRKVRDWFVATSEKLPGLYLADSSYDALYAIIPEGIQLLYKVEKNKTVTVEPVKASNIDDDPGEIKYFARAAA